MKFASEGRFLSNFTIVWFSLLLFPLLMLPLPTYENVILDDTPDMWRFTAIALVTCALYLLIKPKEALCEIRRILLPGYRILLLISIVLIFILSCLIGQVTSIIYVIALTVFITFAACIWRLPYAKRRKLYIRLWWVTFLFACTAFAIYGRPENRYVGGIHPNIFSQVTIALMFFSLAGWKRNGWISLLVALFFATEVSSRYAMVSVILMYLIHSFVSGDLQHTTRRNPVLVIALGTGAIIAFFIFDLTSYIWEALAIDDPLRGLSSGVSGRGENHLAYFLPQLFERPLLGYGFRNKADFISPHNGYLSFVLETGLIVSLIFFTFLAGKLIASIRLVSRLRSTSSEGLRESSGVLALLLALLTSSLFQPQLLNMGDLFAFLMMLALAQNDQTLGAQSHRVGSLSIQKPLAKPQERRYQSMNATR
jgi:hypothetical protein